MTPELAAEDWVGTGYAAKRLGYSQVTMWRLARNGTVPSIRAGKEFRLPGRLVEDVRAAVMSGQSIVLAEFAREWSARHAAEAVA